jgi:hypothetical protein
MKPHDWEEISKLDAAHRQLRTALRMYFSGDDIVSTHTIACASREIYEKHCKLAGIPRYADFIFESWPELDEKTYWTGFNFARNFFKHPDQTGDLSSSLLFSDVVNKATLFNVCHDCRALCGKDAPAEVTVFFSWFYATSSTHVEWSDPVVLQDFGELIDEIEQRYPGLRKASEVEQKLFGKTLLDHAVENFPKSIEWINWMKGRTLDYKMPIEDQASALPSSPSL